MAARIFAVGALGNVSAEVVNSLVNKDIEVRAEDHL